MAGEVKRLDPSRRVTAAVSGGVLNDDCIADNIDVMMLNYQLPLLDAYHAKHPMTPLISGETHCVLSQRGSDETSLAPWGETAETTWKHIAARPFVAGLFVWSGFDYRGEPTPHAWPYVTSQFGQLDICGFEKKGFAQHQGFFGVKPRPVANEPAAGLRLEIHPSADAPVIPADGRFALPITVSASTEANVTFAISGPARIIGLGNGDPKSHESDKASSRSLFRGLAQVIVQMTTTPGEITLTASADGLPSAKLTFHSIVAPIQPSAPPAQRKHFVTDWRMSAITPQPPDVNAKMLEQDVNSWERIEPGRAQSAWLQGGGYAIYRAKFTPPRSMQASGGMIVFRAITGSADIFLDGKLVGQKQDLASSAFAINFPPTTKLLELAVILHSVNVRAGLTDKVELRYFAKLLRKTQMRGDFGDLELK
jgi:hypothetical protein